MDVKSSIILDMKKIVKVEIKVNIPKGKAERKIGLMMGVKKKLKKDNLGKKVESNRLKEKIKPFGK